ncbi:MAG: protoporphyrinogen oxidase, partial [Acidimicrobiales bacterium]
SRFGGNLQSATVGGRAVDLGADAFLARRPEAVELCKELGIDDDLVAPGSPTASVWARGELRPLPDGLALGVPTRIGPLARSGIMSALGLVRAGLDLIRPFRPDPASTEDRSVGELVRDRLGAEVRDMLAGPLVGGIHAGRVDDLSAQAVFPALLDASRERGSLMRALRPQSTPTRSGSGPPGESTRDPVFLSPITGMASIPETLCSALRSKGVELLTSQSVRSVRRAAGSVPADGQVGRSAAWSVSTSSMELVADALVVAIPARAASELLAGVDDQLAGLVGGVPSASVVVVTLQMDAAALSRPLSGTGFLVPAIGGGLITAGTFLTTKWPHLAREGDVLVRASAGRAGDDRASSIDDEKLVEVVLGELAKMIGKFGEPRQAVVTRFGEAFPQYLVGHVEMVSAIEAAAARLPSFALAGAAYHGIGVPACIGSGRKAARLVLSALGAPAGVT